MPKSKSAKKCSELLKASEIADTAIASFSEGILKSLMETSNVAELILNSINSLIYGIGKNISVISHTIIKSIGLSIESISKTLGGYIKEVPLVGETTAYLIEKTGSSINYVIIPVADLVSLTTDTVLDTTTTLKDVLVFTVSSAGKISSRAIKNSQKTIEKLTSVGKKTVSSVVDDTLVSGLKKSMKKLKLSKE